MLFIFATIGLTLIITESYLFRDVRNYLSQYSSLVTCNQCVGFWSGALVGTWLYDYQNLIFYGFAGSFLSMLGARILDYLEVS